MQQIQRKNKRLTLKAMAVIIGGCLWLALSHERSVTLQLDVPVSIYNHEDTIAKMLPESVTITLKGKRADLYMLSDEELALHIDAQAISCHTKYIRLTPDMLLLPHTIQLVQPTILTCV